MRPFEDMAREHLARGHCPHTWHDAMLRVLLERLDAQTPVRVTVRLDGAARIESGVAE